MSSLTFEEIQEKIKELQHRILVHNKKDGKHTTEELQDHDKWKKQIGEYYRMLKPEPLEKACADIRHHFQDKKANMALWIAYSEPDTKYLTNFDLGTFKGTAIDPVYLYSLATERWGPVGKGWGWEEIESGYQNGAPGKDNFLTQMHWVKGRVWYTENGVKYFTPVHYGQTPYIYCTAKGIWKTDFEAPKKSITDMACKCLSILGFASKIYMGLFDGNKYIDRDTSESYEPKARQKTKPNPKPKPKPEFLTLDQLKAGVDECKSADALLKWKRANGASINNLKTDLPKIQEHYEKAMAKFQPAEPDFFKCPDGGNEITEADCLECVKKNECERYVSTDKDGREQPSESKDN